MSIEQKLPDGNDVLAAWHDYRKTESYKTAKEWASYKNHIDGSFWTIFYAGFCAGANVSVEQE